MLAIEYFFNKLEVGCYAFINRHFEASEHYRD